LAVQDVAPGERHDPLAEPSTDLASARTSLALQRSEMAADRTLMAILRTSLSLIGFGFTIYQFLGKIAVSGATSAVTKESARNFGAGLVLLGIGFLIAGLIGHARTLADMHGRRDRLFGAGLLRRAANHNATATEITSILLLALGAVAIAGMLFRTGPLQ
jgi:putative membrane protein